VVLGRKKAICIWTELPQLGKPGIATLNKTGGGNGSSGWYAYSFYGKNALLIYSNFFRYSHGMQEDMLPKSTDAEQIEQIRSGDAAAFEQLMEAFQRPILAFVYRMIGDPDEAQDLSQEIFVRAYQAICAPRFRLKRATLSTWLFQIARNAAIDTLRKRSRKPFLSSERFPGRRDTLPDPGAQPDDQTAANELQARIGQALLQLPEDQHTALVLSVYHDQSHEQIAAILHCSAKSVEARIYRARKKLAAWLL